MKRGRSNPAAERRTYRATERFLALASPKPMGEIFPPEQERKARATPKPSDRPLEKDVQKEILAAVKAHPKVAFCGRFNRGIAKEGNRFIQYNTVAGFTDLHGMTVGGKAFYIEVKRDKSGRVSDAQNAFISLVRQAGGCAGVVYTVEQAMELLTWA